MKETDLYQPVKSFLEKQGYEVKGEVLNCDILAVRHDETAVIVELKLSLNLALILQAVDRLVLSPQVYIGVPKHCASLKKQRKKIIKLLKMLGIGLLLVNTKQATNSIKVLLEPTEYKPRVSAHRNKRLLKEFSTRVGDPNLGGSATSQGRITAYRQQAILIASYLNKHGPSKSSDICSATQVTKTWGILYRNVYGWFDRVTRGTYALSQKGKDEISNWE